MQLLDGLRGGRRVAVASTIAAAIVTIALFATALWLLPTFFRSNEFSGRDDLPELQFVHEFPTLGPVASMLWTSDGSKLATADILPSPSGALVRLPSPFGKSITIWDSDGQAVRTLARPQPFITAADNFAFVGGDKQVVAPPMLSSNSQAFSVFDVDSGEIVHEVAGPFPDKALWYNRVRQFAASPDQSILTLVFPQTETIALYSTRDWSKLGDLQPPYPSSHPSKMVMSHDGKLVAVGSRFADVYSLQSRKIVQRITVPYGVNWVAFNSDDSMIAVATDTVRVFGVATASLVAAYPSSLNIDSIAWIPNSSIIAFLTNYHELRFWNPLDSDTAKRTFELKRASSLAVSPDGRKLAVDAGEHVSVFLIKH